MNVLMDILRFPFEVLVALLNLMTIAFTTWWIWLIWAAVLACLAVAFRRDLRFAIEGQAMGCGK